MRSPGRVLGLEREILSGNDMCGLTISYLHLLFREIVFSYFLLILPFLPLCIVLLSDLYCSRHVCPPLRYILNSLT